MFKNASIFRITLPPQAQAMEFDVWAQDYGFVPCGPSQERSVGWVEPRGHANGATVERIGGQIIMRLMIETKAVPAQTVQDAVDAEVARIEQTTGRKPGKKETRELKDDARRALLPHAFAKRTAVWVWIDPVAGLLVVDSNPGARTDEVLTQLVHLVDGIKIDWVNFGTQPASLMTNWLMQAGVHEDDLGTFQSPEEMFGFDIGRACELKASDESKAAVRYARHDLDTEEVKNHILSGKMATRLALTHLDRVAFTLTDMGTLAGINVLDVAITDRMNATLGDRKGDMFDADVAIITGELKPLIENLFLALDVQPVEEAA